MYAFICKFHTTPQALANLSALATLGISTRKNSGVALGVAYFMLLCEIYWNIITQQKGVSQPEIKVYLCFIEFQLWSPWINIVRFVISRSRVRVPQPAPIIPRVLAFLPITIETLFFHISTNRQFWHNTNFVGRIATLCP